MLFCTICEEEVPFHTGSDEKNLVCKLCIRVNKDPKAGKITGLDSLQKVFEKSLEFQPKGFIEMTRLTLYCNFARDKVVMFDDVPVRFDEKGYGNTPSHNRSKIAKFMKQRPGRVSIVDDAPKPAEVTVPDPPKEDPKEEVVSAAFTEDLVKVEEKVEAPKETKSSSKKKVRKSKKKDTEDN